MKTLLFLPEFDIYVGSFRADNLVVGAPVTGEEQRADLSGSADIRAGRAMVTLDAATTRSGDRLTLDLNAEPDEQKLDLNADIAAPAGGVIANYLGLERGCDNCAHRRGRLGRMGRPVTNSEAETRTDGCRIPRR